jgi:hypothetical protein
MPFDEHWERMVLVNPGLADPDNKLSLSTTEFRRQMERMYQRGIQDGMQVAEKEDDPLGDLFDMFRQMKG